MINYENATIRFSVQSNGDITSGSQGNYRETADELEIDAGILSKWAAFNLNLHTNIIAISSVTTHIHVHLSFVYIFV